MTNIDELYARWQKNPDTQQTIAICDALRGSNRTDLVEIVGEHASRQLQVPALVAAARMYTDTGRLDDAQNVLLAAGRLAPRDGDVFRWLGEVLLRRGDAERAEKVLERAVSFGTGDPGAKQWLDRARHLVATQKSSGVSAVADEVSRSYPSVKGGVAERIVPRAPDSDDDVETEIRKNDDVKHVFDAAIPRPAAGAPAPMQQQTGANAGSAAFNSAGAFGGSGTAHQAFIVAKTEPDSSRMPFGPPPQARAKEPEIPMNPFLAASIAKPAIAPAGTPEPRDVLEALQIAGVFEPNGAVGPNAVAWDKPPPSRGRMFAKLGLVAFVCLSIGAGIGTFYTVQSRRAREHVEAEAILAKVDADLAAGDAKLLDDSEKKLARAFDLESRSPHAALTWLHERAMVGLLKGGADLAFEDAVVRAKEVGVPEKQVLFAHIASFLFQGDTAGAVATIAKWDAQAANEPWFNLLAGATFERVGDGKRALERYAAAEQQEKGLFVTKVLTVRATAVDGDPAEAAKLAKALRGQYPDRLETAALLALAWARDPRRGEPPPELKEIDGKADELPTSLRAVAHATHAILALEKHEIDEAKSALNKGINVAETPGIAAWLGSVALSTGDEALARKAALAAVSFSAVYPPARVLAARVALLGARLDEALKATEDLPPQSADVAVVNAAAAYEKADGVRMASAFEPLPDDAKKLPFMQPLLRGQALMAGSFGGSSSDKILQTADDDAPWADLVAMDAVLDSGDLDAADKIAQQWKGDVRPLRAVRLARLARYQNKLEDADKYSDAAVKNGTVTLRSLAERVYTLVAMNKAHDAISLMKSYPNVGGSIWKWLRAYAVASGGGKIEEARALVAGEDAPPALAPMPARMIAASAYGAMKDTRHGSPYVMSIVSAGFSNPDTSGVTEKLGLGKAGRRR